MSSPVANLENFLIPLNEIISATGNFHKKNEITDGEYSKLYRGQLSESWENLTATFKCFISNRCDGKKEFLNELKVISNLNHENITPFIGYCDEGEEMIMVYGYPVNGSLHSYLEDPINRSCLTWQQRLEICLDAARGLNYLHSGLGQLGTVIHGSFMCRNILLDDNLKAKICGFEFSEFIPDNQPCQQVYKPHRNEDIVLNHHKDPIYLETGFLKVESDIYSFGVLLFCLLAGPDAYNERDCIPNSLMKVQHHYDNRLDSLIDPAIRDQIGSSSFWRIEEITRKCLSYDMKDRPTLDTLVKRISDALDIHENREKAVSVKRSPVKGSRGEYQNPTEFHIPYKEIELARGKSESRSLPCRYIELYTAELSERWPNRTVAFKNYIFGPWDPYGRERTKMFNNELEILSRFQHENITPYIGYCDDEHEYILIYEHAINGSLRDHLQDPDKLCCIPWEQRLKICLGVARGLKCLHSGLWDENILVVHRYVRSENILLDENMEAKISGFCLSIFVPRNKPQVSDSSNWKFGVTDIIKYYEASMDPIYKESCIVNTEVDVYSFGLVMFEILSGVSLITSTYNDISDLIIRVHRHRGDKGMDKLIDPSIRDQIDGRSLQTFVETAYRCLSYNIKERPSMNRIVKKIEEALYFQNHKATISTTAIPGHQYQKLEDFFIPLKEISLATCEFSKTSQIGNGGFGVVYKGRLSEQWLNHEVAIKRLDKTGHQGKKEFLNELQLISRFHHQNIIPFVGYCDEGDEMILVYEYANNGSLDYHLQDKTRRRCLTWVNRLKICLGAANGLDHLHTGLGEDHKVIHRDVKSGNILLDENLEAKICDFGLSKSNSATQQQTKLYTNAAGTNYYVDPIYHESGILRTESDVYSFGVVMFEMLSGMPAWHRRSFGKDKPQPLINLVRRYHDYGKHLLIDPQIKSQIDKKSFHTFIEIAYQCISFNSKERPTMEMIVDKIEEALDFQEIENDVKEVKEKVDNSTVGKDIIKIKSEFSPQIKDNKGAIIEVTDDTEKDKRIREEELELGLRKSKTSIDLESESDSPKGVYGDISGANNDKRIDKGDVSGSIDVSGAKDGVVAKDGDVSTVKKRFCCWCRF